MNVIFCSPQITMKSTNDATDFYNKCKEILDQYLFNVKYIDSKMLIQKNLIEEANKDDILIFFNSENGEYDDQILKLIKKYNDKHSRIWAVAMELNPECRRPPEPVSDKQSFDVSVRNENRNPRNNNMPAIAHIFARKIIAQTLSPLYRDEVLYFISHRRSDGERLASKLADKLSLLTRERNVYRDVVNVAVGDDAQKDIDKNLKLSDVLIFLQTKEAGNSEYIMKELCYALLNDIPVLWVQIDEAPYDNLEIRPGDAPLLSYKSEEFEDDERLIEIADEIEDACFKLIMESSWQVHSYVECLTDMHDGELIKISSDTERILAYEVEYTAPVKNRYGNKYHCDYVQCFGRNPKPNDIENFAKYINNKSITNYDSIVLLSSHGKLDKIKLNDKIQEDNYDDYIANMQNVSGKGNIRKNKKIILSGAFPEDDEIYKLSLYEAVVTYAKEIIKSGYTLVFGAHPTFQNIIFEIGKLYSRDPKSAIEMHMDKAYENPYDTADLRKNCTLILSDGLQKMRETMICGENIEAMVCLGGKIKNDKSKQGVDIEVGLAKQFNIPVALVGTVGGRSSEYAFEIVKNGNWNDINPWGKEFNERLFYNVNHRLMSSQLLRKID